VLSRHVVEHQVEHEADPLVAQRRREPLQILDITQVGAHLTVGRDGIPPVVVPVPRAQQRHEMQVGDPQLLQVVDPLGDSSQRPGEAIGVGRVTEHPRLLQPVRLEDALLIQPVQVRVAIPVCRGRPLHEPDGHLVGVRAVELAQRLGQLVPAAQQPQLEGLPALR
jgi:hypothetical protein